MGYACQKEPIDNKVFVERYLKGQWLVTQHIELDFKNSDTLRNDTTLLLPPDTVAFTTDFKFIKNTDTIAYAVDAMGENINFTTTPDSTWHIGYVRTAHFRLIYTRTETIGSDVYTYTLLKDFNKQP